VGHKGVSIRKLPKAKSKPFATVNHGSGAVSDLAQSEGARGQLPEKPGMTPFGKGRKNPSSGSKKRRQNH